MDGVSVRRRFTASSSWFWGSATSGRLGRVTVLPQLKVDRLCSIVNGTADFDPEETFNGTLIDHEVGDIEDAQRIVTANASRVSFGCADQLASLTREKGEETHDPRLDGASFSGTRVTTASRSAIGCVVERGAHPHQVRRL